MSRLFAGRWTSAFVLGLTLVGLVFALGAGPPPRSIVLEAIADTYVVTDNNDPEDTQGLRSRNFGALDFIRTWYVWKVVGEEQIVSLGLYRFDLTPLKGKEIRSAHLQLFSIGATLAQPARLVDVHAVTEGEWSEGEVNFTNRPSWTQNPVATTAVYGPGVWYSWDVSGNVIRQAARANTIGFVTGLRAIEDKKEELVLFASREVGRNAPRLVVTYEAGGGFPWYLWVGGAGAVVVIAAAAFLGGRLQVRRPAAARVRTRREAGATDDDS